MDIWIIWNYITKRKRKENTYTAEDFDFYQICSQYISDPSSNSRGEPGEHPPPNKTPENLQRKGNSPRLIQQWESIVKKILNFC